MTRIYIGDTTLRDGSHAVAHQYTPEQVAEIAGGLDEAGVDIIEVTHGDGLSGSSLQYGFSATSDEELISAASRVISRGKLAVLLIPGIGTKKDLEMARKYGAQMVRVATHCTEADISEQHIKLAKDMGMTVGTFLMMAHMIPAGQLVEQAKLMESYGADIVYCVDSAGAMLPPDVTERIAAMKKELSVEVGFHAHNNLNCAIGNSLAAVKAGATYIDGCLNGAGAGAGNARIESVVAVLKKAGYDIGVDFYRLLDVADNVFRKIVPEATKQNGTTLMLGYAGVYSSFLLHTYRAAEKFDVDPRDVLVELGRKRIVGGQEDTIVDVAYDMACRKV